MFEDIIGDVKRRPNEYEVSTTCPCCETRDHVVKTGMEDAGDDMWIFYFMCTKCSVNWQVLYDYDKKEYLIGGDGVEEPILDFNLDDLFKDLSDDDLANIDVLGDFDFDWLDLDDEDSKDGS